jgi:hypothetical protein
MRTLLALLLLTVSCHDDAGAPFGPDASASVLDEGVLPPGVDMTAISDMAATVLVDLLGVGPQDMVTPCLTVPYYLPGVSFATDAGRVEFMVANMGFQRTLDGGVHWVSFPGPGGPLRGFAGTLERLCTITLDDGQAWFSLTEGATWHRDGPHP